MLRERYVKRGGNEIFFHIFNFLFRYNKNEMVSPRP